MINFLKAFGIRICNIIGWLLFLTTIISIVPLLFIYPIYWFLTGRSYWDDVELLIKL